MTKSERLDLGFAVDRRDDFTTTQWSVVLQAGHNDPQRALEALEHLCRRYWMPLYAFVRRRGYGTHQAEDLTQAFFERLLQKDAIQKVDRSKGRFRTFLLGSLNNFLTNEWDKAVAQKRGGKLDFISFDHPLAESLGSDKSELTAERFFEKQWAATIVQQVRERLRREYKAAKKEALYQKLEPGITAGSEDGFCANCARELGITDGAAKVALHRLRRRFGELLRSEIAHTVSSPEDIDEELRVLLAAIAE